MKFVTLKNGAKVSALGLGTWEMGQSQSARAAEVKALQAGLDLGVTLIDTAEMYASGGAEEVVGEAIRGRRDKVYLVTKVLPDNAGRKDMAKSCEKSLRRMGAERIDLYLLHWRGGVPLAETMAGFDDLMKAGKIAGFGVSNFDMRDMRQWLALAGGERTLANQVFYAVNERGIDFDLSPYCKDHGVAVMAYCPLNRGKFPSGPGFKRVMARHRASAAQIMLAWTMREDHLITIPKSSRVERVVENVKAADIVLDRQDLADIDADHPRPSKAMALAMT
jgi:diketogulonate reductase-like aldo/keto reductase